MNQGLQELAHTKLNYPELYQQLADLSKEDDLISRYFKYSQTFDEVDSDVDAWIERERQSSLQLSFF